jgi:hypothetical protein
VRGLVRRVHAGHCHHARDRLSRDRRLARLARFVAQQPVDPFFGEPTLPAPHHRPADAELSGHTLHGIALAAGKHDGRALDVFCLPIAAGDNRLKLRPIRYVHDYADRLCHATRIAQAVQPVNRLNASEH